MSGVCVWDKLFWCDYVWVGIDLNRLKCGMQAVLQQTRSALTLKKCKVFGGYFGVAVKCKSSTGFALFKRNEKLLLFTYMFHWRLLIISVFNYITRIMLSLVVAFKCSLHKLLLQMKKVQFTVQQLLIHLVRKHNYFTYSQKSD